MVIRAIRDTLTMDAAEQILWLLLMAHIGYALNTNLRIADTLEKIRIPRTTMTAVWS